MPVRVLRAEDAVALDAYTIAAGVPARALMQRAGAAAAGEITCRFPARARRGVGVLAGPGNNGGDGWVVARALALCGLRTVVEAVGETRSADARAERALTEPLVVKGEATAEPLIVDGLLGTGVSGAPRGEIAAAITRVNDARARGATVIALDVPSGLGADPSRPESAVTADLTITFGAVKRELLAERAQAGRILVLDIGLLDRDGADPELVTARWVRATLPAIAPDADKGARKRLAIAGGETGMAGAPVLAARAAMRTGVGLIRLVVSPASVAAVQVSEPHALAVPWPGEGAPDEARSLTKWAHGMVIGPGLGTSPASRRLVERLLESFDGPVVVDADGLNVFRGEVAALAALLRRRPALLTPHRAECARLLGVDDAEVDSDRYGAASRLACDSGAAVLLKGVPTLIADADGVRYVSAAGTPALAAGGSGDLLAGIAATLLTQMGDPLTAGACAAWIHGRAAELAQAGRSLRGTTLDDVLEALDAAWREPDEPPRYPVLAELPAIAGR